MNLLSPSSLVLALAAVTIGAAIQGSLGFGLAIVAAPILVLISPGLVPGPLLMASLCLTFLVMRREHSFLDFHGLKWGVIGRVIGTLLGVMALSRIPVGALSITVGAAVLAGVIMSVIRMDIRPVPVHVFWAGILSGIMGTTASLGGPPLALVYQNAPPNRVRSTLGAYFLIGSPLSLAALAMGGHFGWKEMKLSALLVPGVLVGYVLSRKLIRHVDRGRFRAPVIALCALAGAAAVIKGLFLK